MEGVMVEYLENSLVEAKMMITRTRMRSKRIVRTKGETIQIVHMIRIIEIKEEEGEGEEMEDEAFMENVSTTMKKGINNLNVLNAKEEMIEEMNGRVEV